MSARRRRRWMVLALLASLGTVLAVVMLIGSPREWLARVPAGAPLVRLNDRLFVRAPQASGKKLAIVIAQIADDPDGTHREWIRQTLSRHEGIELLMLDRTIPVAGSPEDLRAAHRHAMRLLEQAQADAMIWGRTDSVGPHSRMQLHWTQGPYAAYRNNAEPDEAAPLLPDLPALDWLHLRHTVSLLAACEVIAPHRERDAYRLARLTSFIALIASLDNSSSLAPREQADLLSLLGYGLLRSGVAQRDLRSIAYASRAFRTAGQLYKRESAQRAWLVAQNNLGVALHHVAIVGAAPASLNEALKIYREALAEGGEEEYPLEWMRLQTNVALALALLANDAADFEASVSTFRRALDAPLPKTFAADRAATLTGLGRALVAMGRQQSGISRLQEAVAAHRSAVDGFPQSRAPLAWAAANTRLGVALTELGDRETASTHLEEAVRVLRGALTVYTLESAPWHWAETQNSLADALATLGVREPGSPRLNEAVDAYRLALGATDLENVPAREIILDDLADALTALAEREGNNVVRLEEAVAARREIAERHPRSDLLAWARAQHDLGFALALLGEHEGGSARLDEAAAAFRLALEQPPSRRAAADRRETQYLLAKVQLIAAQRASASARIAEAIGILRTALRENPRERLPLEWAKLQQLLALALAALGEQEAGTARLYDAAAAYGDLGEFFKQAQASAEWSETCAKLERVVGLIETREPGTKRVAEMRNESSRRVCPSWSSL